ncbi:MAG TPA: hypothetical protein VHQ47_05645 [Phycisphaerae bacterium]|nr:hypothetical protein [Phycisphaerae bacterium]
MTTVKTGIQGAEPGASVEPLVDERRMTHGLARLVLAAFVFTFISARILVILIMAGNLPPQLFFHVSGTHVHHLNYGIFLLSVTNAVLLFARPKGKWLSTTAIFYGIGLALTFDEFGMWLHLGGPYWQRASYDAIILIAAMLALIAYGSTIRRWRPRHWWAIVLLAAALGVFGWMLADSVRWAGNRLGPVVEQLEQRGPT